MISHVVMAYVAGAAIGMMAGFALSAVIGRCMNRWF